MRSCTSGSYDRKSICLSCPIFTQTNSQPLFWANQLLVICLPLPHTEAICKRSSYCPTDIWNYAIWFEFLYVKVKLPVTPFPWWQVLYLDQHNYSWADVDTGVTRSLEPFCNDNLMIQVVAKGLLYAFGSPTASDVIGPLRVWRHGYFPVSSSFPLAVYFNVQSKSLLHCHFKSLLTYLVVVCNRSSRGEVNWELPRVRWPLQYFSFAYDPSEPTHTCSGVAVICTATPSVDAEA